MRGFVGGFIGGIVFVMIVITICLFCHRHNSVIHPIHIANIEAVNDSIPIDEVNAKIEAINKLKNQGVLLTPQEYTNNVVNYYNTVITFLVALLAVFSLVTFFHLKFITVDEVKKQVTELLRKSPDVQNILVENTKGRIDELLFDATERIANLEAELKRVKESSKWDKFEDDSEVEDEADLERIKVKK